MTIDSHELSEKCWCAPVVEGVVVKHDTRGKVRDDRSRGEWRPGAKR